MTLGELLKVIYSREKVCVYHATGSEDNESLFEDEYLGEAKLVPKELLPREVFTVSSTSRGKMDIQVLPQQEKNS